MARLQPFQRHAITAPVFDKTKLHRARLVQILQDNLWRKLILIVAPAGYGKTTLLADLTAHTDRPVCWVRLTEHDQDPMRLYSVLAASLALRFRRLKSLGRPRDLTRIDCERLARVVGDEIGEKVRSTFALVIDDFHLIQRSDPARMLVASLVGHLPSTVCLAIASREAVDLPIARLAASSAVTVVGAGDLALESDELEDLLHLSGNEGMTASRERELLAASRGWITGVLLSGLQGRHDLVTGLSPNRPLTVDYFATSVLDGQPSDLKKFVKEASVLPVMSAEAVNEVLGRNDGGLMLRSAARAGLFISASGASARSFEFHPLFRDFLFSELMKGNRRRARTLRMRVARYLAGNGEEDQAVEEYISAGAPRSALLVAERAARNLRMEGRLETLKKWDGLLSSGGVASGWVLLRLSYLLADRGQASDALRVLRRGLLLAGRRSDKALKTLLQLHRGFLYLGSGNARAARQLARACIRRAIPKSGGRAILAEAYRLAAAALVEGNGDLRAAAQYSAKAVRLLRNRDPSWRIGGLMAHWSVLAWMGRREGALKASRECEKLMRFLNWPYQLTIFYNNLASNAALDGDFRRAIPFAERALALSQKLGDPLGEGLVLLTMADTLSDVGRMNEAMPLYDRARPLFSRGSVSWLRYCVLRKSIALRRMGEHSQAKRELSSLVRDRVADSWNREIVVERVAQTSLRRPRVALEKINRLLAASAHGSSAWRRVSLEAHRARILAGLGEPDGAARCLRRGLRLAGGLWATLPLLGEITASEELKRIAETRFTDDPRWIDLQSYLTRAAEIPQGHRFALAQHKTFPSLVISALGGLGVEYHGTGVGFTPKVKELLLYIVDQGAVGRDALVELFWGHLSPENQLVNLHAAIYALRRKLGKSAFRVSKDLVELGGDLQLEYDVQVFQKEVEVARAIVDDQGARLLGLEHAASLYEGSFAPHLDSRWVQDRRAQLEQLFTDAVVRLGQTALEAQRSEIAIPHLRRALSVDAYREDIAGLLSRCLLAAGRRAEAEHSLSAFVSLLRKDLGLWPGERITRLMSEIRDAVVASKAPDIVSAGAFDKESGMAGERVSLGSR